MWRKQAEAELEVSLLAALEDLEVQAPNPVVTKIGKQDVPTRAGEMAQLVKVLAAKTGNLS